MFHRKCRAGKRVYRLQHSQIVKKWSDMADFIRNNVAYHCGELKNLSISAIPAVTPTTVKNTTIITMVNATIWV